jgi:hypothetical protein
MILGRTELQAMKLLNIKQLPLTNFHQYLTQLSSLHSTPTTPFESSDLHQFIFKATLSLVQTHRTIAQSQWARNEFSAAMVSTSMLWQVGLAPMAEKIPPTTSVEVGGFHFVFVKLLLIAEKACSRGRSEPGVSSSSSRRTT